MMLAHLVPGCSCLQLFLPHCVNLCVWSMPELTAEASLLAAAEKVAMSPACSLGSGVRQGPCTWTHTRLCLSACLPHHWQRDCSRGLWYHVSFIPVWSRNNQRPHATLSLNTPQACAVPAAVGAVSGGEGSRD